MSYYNRDFVDNGGILYDTDRVTDIEICIRREDKIDKEIQTVTYSFVDVFYNTIIGYAYNWQDVLEKLDYFILNSMSVRRIEAMVRLKARINAQKQ